MAGIGFRVSGQGMVNAAAKELGARGKRLREQNAKSMHRAVLAIESDLKRNGMRGKNGNDPFWGRTGAPGDELGTGTGNARKSIVQAVFTRLLTVVGVVGSPLVYVAQHEFGGTIKGNPWLRIPTRVMKGPGGVDKLAGRSAKTLPNTTIITSKRGIPWIVEVGTARSDLAREVNGFPLMLYMLVREVKHRPRGFMKATLARMLPRVQKQFQQAAGAIVRGG